MHLHTKDKYCSPKSLCSLLIFRPFKRKKRRNGGRTKATDMKKKNKRNVQIKASHCFTVAVVFFFSCS